MSASIVLTEKLRRPEPVGLPRRRLEARLLDSAESRLDLVVAPPGSGKTTLLARVAAAAATLGPVAWYRVTADDGAETALVAHLARALRDTAGIDAADASMSALLESLENWPAGRAFLILDDLHEIAGSSAERALEQFILLRPQALRVLAGSRRQPEINIPRLRVSGALQEVSSDDLRFRSWEVEELFISIFREPLSPESAAALTRRTGGWAAGLQLFHLATSGRSALDRKRAVDDLGGRSKLVRSYLARNVLAELPEDRRLFLLRTCTLGSLTGALCDRLLETTGSHRVLDELEQQQLFTSSDDDGETFRYHQVLRSHLEWALVEELGAAGARQWYARSAAVLEEIGDQRGAVRAYARAEDWGAVARIIQTRGHGPHDATAGANLLLPPAVVENDPWLSFAEARRRVRDGALESAIQAFRQAENLLDEPDFRENCRRERTIAELWTAGPDARRDRVDISHWSVPLRMATRQGRSARDGAGWNPTLRAESQRTGALQTDAAGTGQQLATGTAALLHGDFSRARAALAVSHDPDADGSHRLLAQLAGVLLDLLTAACDDPAGRLGQICLEAEVTGLPWVARLARGFAEAVLVAQGSPPWRSTACADLIEECDRAGDEWGAALLSLAAACAVQLAGQVGGPPAGPEGFADTARRFRLLDAAVPAVWAEALQACVQARDAAPDAAEVAQRAAGNARAIHLDAAQALAQAALAVATGAGNAALSTALTRAVAVAGLFLQRPDVTDEPDEPNRPDVPTSQGSPTLSVRCFGGFAIEVDSVAVELTALRPRARTLLRLLAMNAGRDVHRELLVDALWPGVDVVIGTRRLQVAVSSVRQLLESAGLSGSEVLVRHGDAYRLAPPPGSVIDVLDFENGLRAPASDIDSRATALALYKGDLLPEEGPAEYVVVERDRLRLMAAAAATTLARESRALGRDRQALDAARLSVQLDRYQDLGWQLLIELHETSGDSTAASLARREHARAQAELGVPTA
ncbi:winged helix-turn-helix domain-containing protein [Nakamurella sp. GG22]